MPGCRPVTAALVGVFVTCSPETVAFTEPGLVPVKVALADVGMFRVVVVGVTVTEQVLELNDADTPVTTDTGDVFSVTVTVPAGVGSEIVADPEEMPVALSYVTLPPVMDVVLSYVTVPPVMDVVLSYETTPPVTDVVLSYDTVPPVTDVVLSYDTEPPEMEAILSYVIVPPEIALVICGTETDPPDMAFVTTGTETVPPLIALVVMSLIGDCGMLRLT